MIQQRMQKIRAIHWRGFIKNSSEFSVGAACISEFFARGCYLVIPPLCKGRQGGVESLKYLEPLMFPLADFRRRGYLPLLLLGASRSARPSLKREGT
jgi:hypothetical protein